MSRRPSPAFVRRQPLGPDGRADHSLHLSALQIRAHGQWACVELLQFSDCGIKIELTDVTDNESPNARVLGDPTDDRRRSVKRTRCTCGNGEMHNQDVRSLRELDESWVGTGLIGAEYDRHVPCLYAVRQSREIAVRYSQSGHSHSLPVEHCRRFCFRHIDNADIETNASPRVRPAWHPAWSRALEMRHSFHRRGG